MTTPGTVGGALAAARGRLAEVGIVAAALEARLLVAHALAAPVEHVVGWPERPLAAAAAARLETALARRARREPMSQILGRREFWSLPFLVTRDTLTPRPDSETLVAAALDYAGNRGYAWRVLDFGTGTGCLLLAVLAELPQATGLGIDRSAAALAMAQRNAAALGLADRARFAAGDWGAALNREFDLILANPPYIPDGAIAGLDPEVRDHEPRLALAGGPDGLAAYLTLAFDIRRLLAADGVAVMEVGEGQAMAVEAILGAAGLVPAGRRTDLQGIDRCLLARPGPKKGLE